MLLKVAELCRRLGRLPTRAEIKLRRKSDPTFPSHGAVANHFPTNADFVLALRKLAATEGYGDLLPMLPAEAKPQEPRQSRANEGSVYLLKSGNHYKIGRSDDLERRVKEVRIALPEFRDPRSHDTNRRPTRHRGVLASPFRGSSRERGMVPPDWRRCASVQAAKIPIAVKHIEARPSNVSGALRVGCPGISRRVRSRKADHRVLVHVNCWHDSRIRSEMEILRANS